MLNELNEGNGDIHSLVASLMFDELNDVPLKDIKSKYKHLRQLAKGYEFLKLIIFYIDYKYKRLEPYISNNILQTE